MHPVIEAAAIVSRETMKGTGATVWLGGEKATSGYSIGRAAVEVKCPREKNEVLRAATFIGWIIERAAKDGEDIAVGSWLDNDGRVVVEPVDVFPAYMDEADAIAIGRARGQYSIYSLHEDREIVVPVE